MALSAIRAFFQRHANKYTLSLVCTAMGSLFASVLYIFPLIGPSLKERLGYSMKQLNFVAASGNVGSYVFEPLAGICTDWTGSRRTVRIGAVLMFVGYIGLSLLYNGALGGGSFLLGALFLFLMGASASTISITLSISACNSSTETMRGKALGVVLTCTSISSAVYTGIRGLMSVISGGNVDTGAFLLTLAIVATTVHILVSLGLLESPLDESARDEAVDRLESEEESQHEGASPSEVPEIAAIIAEYPRASLDADNESDAAEYMSSDGETTNLLKPPPHRKSHEATDISPGTQPTFSGDTNLTFKSQKESLVILLTSLAFWLVCFIRFFDESVSIMYLNNTGSMVRELQLSRDPWTSDGEIARLEGLQSTAMGISACAGALTVGILGDYLRSKSSDGSMWLMTGTIVLKLAVQIVIYFASNPHALLVTSIISAIANSFMGNIIYIVMFDLWSGPNFGRNSGLTAPFPAVGAQLFSYIFGAIYDRNRSDGCSGASCYRSAFLMSACTYLATLTAVLALWWKLRKLSH
ncbi:major facilitator superfamily domain-containing protein [Thamnocephalis sphaerospora]|uniref:Major facilitator superfamily domain-containing protein n=1 Tax=Thamnocephalis sphaerospora TaxID=78915 RepID=A0A4P9XWP8_9FUNG|nr:major facilitator superfamily domain-containing protein [Thamnocephalis sphaerospora]|eukprot:RKP10726.1 major facilitator superfamily domain-containing protein [Thamnocephalis sphaerospora]